MLVVISSTQGETILLQGFADGKYNNVNGTQEARDEYKDEHGLIPDMKIEEKESSELRAISEIGAGNLCYLLRNLAMTTAGKLKQFGVNLKSSRVSSTSIFRGEWILETLAASLWVCLQKTYMSLTPLFLCFLACFHPTITIPFYSDISATYQAHCGESDIYRLKL